MKTRESGMPDESLWESFFSPDTMLRKLGLRPDSGDVVDFGCGYGTFAIPAARIVRSTVHALDVDPEMITVTGEHARAEGLSNVRATLRDFIAAGSGLPPSSADYVMLFNILHCEQPDVLIREASRVLKVGGQLAIIHWRPDPTTPRGPSLAIRPQPERCREWAEQAGFERAISGILDLPPYHYGLLLTNTKRLSAPSPDGRGMRR
ncbi:MAG TPA: class I SAM-dependent methyltransferase [Tepidisphaeraceae bacterium]|jgi:SAM-dependent methyltransferase